MRPKPLSGALLCAALLLSAGPAAARTLDVVASFTVLADVVREIGGDHVRVKSFVPPNGDPHEFEPSPSDARALKSADLAFVSGDGLETWFKRLAKGAGYKGEPIVASNGVKTYKMEEDGKTVVDPHVWNNPLNVVVWAGNIEKALAAADPEDAAAFKANAAAYVDKLKAADAYAREKIDATPKERRKILTSHDAFGYFGREYGVTFLAPVGFSTETEASAAAVAKLIEQIKREHVAVYFFENSNDKRLVQQIAAATGAEPGGELYVESLSPEGGPAATYLTMFRNNVDEIAQALAKQTSAANEKR